MTEQACCERAKVHDSPMVGVVESNRMNQGLPVLFVVRSRNIELMFTPKSRGYTVIPPHTFFPKLLKLLNPHFQAEWGFFYLTNPTLNAILYGSLTTKHQQHMNLLKTIINQMGYVDAEQCEELASYFPDAELIIQWGYLPREACRATEVAHRIKEGERLQGDYVRSVWFTSSAITKLREVFGISRA